MKTLKLLINKFGKSYIRRPNTEYIVGSGTQVVTGRKFGYIDKTGKYLINRQFSSAENFSNYLARFTIGNPQSYIDKKGQ